MKICIFCGAAATKDMDVYKEGAKVMEFFHRNSIELVYGGASLGVMGSLANELLNRGGKVTGVIPHHLKNKEVAHTNLTHLHVVEDMHSRKEMMYELSDAFLVFPGGMGTLDELFEILTWRQLGLHHKPIALMNINGYFSSLLTFLDHAVEKGLLKEHDRRLLFASHQWEDIWSHYTSQGVK